MNRLIIFTAAGGALLLAGCSSSSHPGAAAKVAHSGASSSSGNCQSQYDAWESAGISHQKKFAAALNNVESADNQFNNDVSAGNNPTADVNTLAGDVGALEGTIGLINNDLPPSCVPGLASDYKTAMSVYGNYASYQILAIGQADKGNTANAQTDLASASALQEPGNTAMQAVINDLNAFSTSGS